MKFLNKNAEIFRVLLPFGCKSEYQNMKFSYETYSHDFIKSKTTAAEGQPILSMAVFGAKMAKSTEVQVL